MKFYGKVLLLIAAVLCVQCTKQSKEEEVNDTTTPLHLLQPEYNVPYGEVNKEDVKAALDRIFQYIDKETPCAQKEDGTLERGAFRISSYEWGITYQALLAAAQATGEEKYSNYVKKCFDFIGEMAPQFREQEK